MRGGRRRPGGTSLGHACSMLSPTRSPRTTSRSSSRTHGAPSSSWDEIERRTSATVLPGDPVFARIFDGELADLVDGPRSDQRARNGTTVVFGPGSALHAHDRLWYADIPKWLSLERVRKGLAGNVGQPAGEAGSEQRLLFVDWPMLDRHKQELLPRIDRYLDVGDPTTPRSLEGDALRESLRSLAERPFRVRPTFFPGPWGGQWLRRRLGIPTDASNLAWSYELITPESGLLLGGDDSRRSGLRAADGGGGRTDPGRGGRCALRHVLPDPLRLPGHARRRSPLDPVPSVGAVRARRLRSPVHAARDLLRRRHDTRREGVPRASRGRRPRGIPDGSRAGGGSGRSRSTRSDSSRRIRPSSIVST